MVRFSALLYFVYIQLDTFICCPVGYGYCNSQDGGTCPPGATTQDHGEIAFGNDTDGVWTYKSLSETKNQRDCTVVEFGDPSPGNKKKCCLTNLTDQIAANVVGEMSCGDTTKVWFRDEINRRHWKLTTTESNDITYYGCNTGFDSTTTVYNSSNVIISNSECPGDFDGFSNDCGSCSSNTAAEEFTLINQPAGVYWIRIGYFNDTSDPGNKIYELTITCNANPTSATPTTFNPTTTVPTTYNPTTDTPTTFNPTTSVPTTANPTSATPTTTNPTTDTPTTLIPTTFNPTTYAPSSGNPTTAIPTTDMPTKVPSIHPTIYPSTHPNVSPSTNPSISPSTAPTYNGGRSVDETTKNPESEDTLKRKDSDDFLSVLIYVLATTVVVCCIGAIVFGCVVIRKRKKQTEQAKIHENVEKLPEYILQTSPTCTTTGSPGMNNGTGETMGELQLTEKVQSNVDTNETDEEQAEEMYTVNVTNGGDNIDGNEHILDGNAYEDEQEDDSAGLYEKGVGNHVTAGDEN